MKLPHRTRSPSSPAERREDTDLGLRAHRRAHTPGGELAVVSDIAFGNAVSDLPALGTGDPVERLRAMIEERQAETVEILRGWMEDDKEETA